MKPCCSVYIIYIPAESACTQHSAHLNDPDSSLGAPQTPDLNPLPFCQLRLISQGYINTRAAPFQTGKKNNK